MLNSARNSSNRGSSNCNYPSTHTTSAARKPRRPRAGASAGSFRQTDRFASWQSPTISSVRCRFSSGKPRPMPKNRPANCCFSETRFYISPCPKGPCGTGSVSKRRVPVNHSYFICRVLLLNSVSKRRVPVNHSSILRGSQLGWSVSKRRVPVNHSVVAAP